MGLVVNEESFAKSGVFLSFVVGGTFPPKCVCRKPTLVGTVSQLKPLESQMFKATGEGMVLRLTMT